MFLAKVSNIKNLEALFSRKTFVAMCLIFSSTLAFSQLPTSSDGTAGTLPLPVQISSDAFNDVGQVGYCIQVAGANSCTANDFTITSMRTINIDDGCSSSDDYMQIDLGVTFNKQTPTRYEVGAWFYRGADSGTDFNTQDAFSGDYCVREGVAAGLAVPGGFTTLDIDGDGCVDVQGNSGNLQEQVMYDLILPCRDTVLVGGAAGSDGITDISACTSWSNLSGHVCNTDAYQEFVFGWPNSPFVGELTPSTGSKCNCGEFDGGPLIVEIPEITVSKTCSPTELAPGETTTCTITISNSGLGALSGSIATVNPSDSNEVLSITSGFIYQDDYPEHQGSVDVGSITPSQPGSVTVSDDFIYNSDGTKSTNQSLNIFPGTIAAGGSLVVTYDFITSASLPTTETDITNTVCAAYYNDSTPIEVFSYAAAEPTDQCDTAVVTTPVSISNFLAVPNKLSGGYEISWTTTTETGNLGFNIYTIVGNTRYKLNKGLIPSNVTDSMSKSSYSVNIQTQLMGLAHKFIIEDVDIYGSKSTNGIYELGKQYGVMNHEIQEKFVDWDMIHQEQQRLTLDRNEIVLDKFNNDLKSLRISEKGNNVINSTILMEIGKTGIYRVTANNLETLGIDLTLLKVSDLRVTQGDRVIPIYVSGIGTQDTFNDQTYFQFFAKKTSSLYTDKSYYTLSFDSTQSNPVINEISSPPRGNNFTYGYEKTVKLERNEKYSYSSPIENEPWYDTRMIAVESPAQYYFNLKSDRKLSNSETANIHFKYWGGLDYSDDDKDHKVNFKLNGIELGYDEFNGITFRESSFSIPANSLRYSNEIEIELTANTKNNVDLVNLESISLTYNSFLHSVNNELHFSHNEENFSVSGFFQPDVDIFAINNDGIYKLKNYKTRKEINNTYYVEFSGLQGNTDYYMLANEKSLTPKLNISESRGVDLDPVKHLVITHPNFINRELSAYIDLTRSNYKIVNVEDIYHTYSMNSPNGDAIKSYIEDVAQFGELESILIIGGDTYDYKNYTGLNSVSFVPTIYRETDSLIKFSAVDSLFGDIDNDSIPDIPVGRLPVRTSRELKVILDKLISYRNDVDDRSAVLAADDSESLDAYQFTSISNNIYNQLHEDGWSLKTAFLDDAPIDVVRDNIIAAMNDGVKLAIYTGHSSSKRWGFEGLFKNTDVKSLTNHFDPFGVIQWGCWNTYFVDPSENTLGHEFMLSGYNGAAFVIGASTLTDANDEAYFSSLFNQNILSEDDSIGSALINAKREFYSSNNHLHKDILWGISILGDPLTKIR